MTVTAPGGPPVSSTIDPTLRASGRRNLPLIATVVAVLAVISLLAYAGGQRQSGFLDPRAVDPAGSRAVANLLAGQGVRVVPVDTATAAADALAGAGGPATLLVTGAQSISERMAQALAGRSVSHTVVVGEPPTWPGPWPSLDAAAGGAAAVAVRDPGCSWSVALRAGPATTGGQTYDLPGASSCYGASVVDLPAGGAGYPAQVTGSTTLLGSPDILTNAHLAEQGNAALALGVVGRDPVLVWWNPSALDPLAAPTGDQPELIDLVPDWTGWAALQLLIGVLVLAYARGRRFGRVVLEPLPVTVRAAETTEGLARLYQRAQGRGHAAGALAAAAAGRLRGPLRLPRGATAEQVAQAAADRTGRPTGELLTLLSPPPPADDAALVRFADDLDTLDRQVRHP